MGGEETGQRVEVQAPPGVHEKVFELALNLPEKHILDVPTGSGTLAKKLLAIGKTVTAGDIDISQLRIGTGNHELTVVRLDLNEDRLPLKDSSFDIVVSVEGIEHLQNQWNFIRNMARVLKPGGLLILTTPNILNIRSRLRYFLEGTYEHFKRPLVRGLSWEHDLQNYHISPISFFELQFMLTSCGFVTVELHTNAYKERNLLTMALRPIFSLIYTYKNYRDKKRDRGDVRDLYKIVTSPELFYGECLILMAKKNDCRQRPSTYENIRYCTDL
jgi:SAM-dependent methyltransferase